MKFNDKYKVAEEFESLFSFASEEEELNHDAHMISFKFLEELEKCLENGPKLKKKDLAHALGKSPSFVSQLYSGEKLMSLNLIALIQKKFNLVFEVRAKMQEFVYESTSTFDFTKEHDGFWFFKPVDYSKSEKICNSSVKEDKKNAA